MNLRVLPVGALTMALPEDDPMLNVIQRVPHWEKWVVDAAMSVVRAGTCFLDIGANIGVFAINAAKRGANVTAIEVSPENCKLILLNSQLNNVTINLIQAAVSDSRGPVLYKKEANTNKNISGDEALTIDSFNDLDLAMQFHVDDIIVDSPDVIKIDIEGHDYNVMASSTRLWQRKPYVFAEYSGTLLEGRSHLKTATQYLKLFVDHGYTINYLGSSEIVEYGTAIDKVHDRYLSVLKQGVTHLDLAFVPNAESLG
ncbi:MAG TPA: FkbM family methyltransferase [Stellaceae bacterium]|jgi:FkbM family methyltransferase|nr:FkbM family methyltransferase [Stellaceae bacterium]